MLRLHGSAAQLLDNLVLINLVLIALRMHDAHHHAFAVCLFLEVHDLLRVTGQLDSDGEDLEFIVRRALAWSVARGLDEDLRVVASISRGQVNIQLLNQLSFDFLPEAEFTVSYLYDAGREAATLGLHQA